MKPENNIFPSSNLSDSPPPEIPAAAPAPIIIAPLVRKHSVFWEWVETILVALILALVLRTFVVQPYQVHLHSMIPTLEEGDMILVSKLSYKLGSPGRQDVVVFLPPVQGAEKDYVKRVIGLPGDTLDIKDGKVYINNEELSEPYAKGPTNGGKYNHIQIEPGTVFVMGDNRTNSSDSRMFGPVSMDKLEGKVLLVFWPFNRMQWGF